MAETDWTEVELKATVEVYLDMLQLELAGHEFSKADRRRALQDGPLSTRSDGSIEYRLQNISHVLTTMGLPFVKGYKPAANVGPRNTPRIQASSRSFGGLLTFASR